MYFFFFAFRNQTTATNLCCHIHTLIVKNQISLFSAHHANDSNMTPIPPSNKLIILEVHMHLLHTDMFVYMYI